MSWQMKRLLRLREAARVCVNILPNGNLAWKSDHNKFTVKGGYYLLEGEPPKPPWPPWPDWIWNATSPPKHSLCVWLAVQNKLRTIDRMPWLHTADQRCCWCLQNLETNSHIFFQCQEMQVLKPLLSAAGFPFHGDSWQLWVLWRQGMSCLSIAAAEIISFLTNAAVFEIWRNRNLTIFRNSKTSSKDIQAKICKMLLSKIYNINHKKKWKSFDKIQLPHHPP